MPYVCDGLTICSAHMWHRGRYSSLRGDGCTVVRPHRIKSDGSSEIRPLRGDPMRCDAMRCDTRWKLVPGGNKRYSKRD
ncbi:hypothetical protein B296_00024027 [Ensete ventricosum]|uniref:Uncharacterized protein n=1 Tax=Ensete ventricosum TaxID=4639 RepID=A0A426Y6R8_ENSVE|nr:hypothetical protein B296_00024027 [Ensete ventricosum]